VWTFERPRQTRALHNNLMCSHRSVSIALALLVCFFGSVSPCLGPQHDSNLELVQKTLQDACFDVAVGYMAFNRTCFPVSLQHPLSDITCFGQNPSSPYGTFHLKTPLLLNKDRPIWQLQEREAVLFLGCTPPNARYFGLQS
jgi:hypothetical protein